MEKLFGERRSQFLLRCLKYARYVFNDHFVLVLMVFLGFLALQYRELLEHFPANPWAVYLLLIAVSFVLFFAGNLATYLEDADQQFLLAKEPKVMSLVRQARLRSFLLWGVLQVLGQLLFLPLYLKLGLSKIGFAVVVLLLTVGKYALMEVKARSLKQEGRLNWSKAIALENGRKQGILSFFALFTTVKGISSRVKRRAYLDFFLKAGSNKYQQTWDYLYLRAYLRSGDFFGLTLRLLVLSFVLMAGVRLSWLVTGFALLMAYLLLFQLTALYSVYDYQYLTRLYPLSVATKQAGFKRVIWRVFYVFVGLEMLGLLYFLEDKRYLLVFVLISVFLGRFYLPVKVKKLID